MHDLAAGGDLVDHVAQADVFLEGVFARLQLAELAFENEPELHERRIGDDAFALELGDDLKQVAARRNIDDLVGRERSGFFQLVHGGDDAEDAGDQRDEHETQEAARHGKRSFATLTLFRRRRGRRPAAAKPVWRWAARHAGGICRRPPRRRRALPPRAGRRSERWRFNPLRAGRWRRGPRRGSWRSWSRRRRWRRLCGFAGRRNVAGRRGRWGRLRHWRRCARGWSGRLGWGRFGLCRERRLWR